MSNILAAIASLNSQIPVETNEKRRSAIEKIAVELMAMQRQITAEKMNASYEEILAECREVSKTQGEVAAVKLIRSRTLCGLREAYLIVKDMKL